MITENAADARHSATEARRLLRRADVTATVTRASEDDYDSLLGGVDGVIAHVSGGRERLDTAVTALTPLGSGRYPFTQEYVTAADDTVTARVTTVSTSNAGAELPRRGRLRRPHGRRERPRPAPGLRPAATGRHAARGAGPGPIRETVIPLAVLAGGTTAMGAFGATQLNKAAGTAINTSGMVQLVICLAVGSLAMLAAIAGSRPLLRRVTSGPARTAD